MKRALNTLTMTAAVAALLVTAACGGSGGGAAVDDSPEGQAYAYRDALMLLIARKNGILGAMSRGEAPDDRALFTKSASDLVVLAGMVAEGFRQEGVAAGSRALPDIWTNMDDFDDRLDDMVAAVAAVSDAAQSGDFEGAKELAGDVGPTCGGCHRPYRAPAD